ncbi:hypothetical protein RCL1_001041 [Eukaryota sp. TZLM3-RCL]
MNPGWSDKDADYNTLFKKAVEIVGEEFIDKVMWYVKYWLPARSIVQEAFNNRFSVHDSGRIMYLSQYCPWKQHLYMIEKENHNTSEWEVLFVLFNDKGNGTVCVSTVPVPNVTGFQHRKSLLSYFWGLRDEKLSTAAEIPDGVFVHHTGFLGSTKSFESSLKLALVSMNSS